MSPFSCALACGYSGSTTVDFEEFFEAVEFTRSDITDFVFLLTREFAGIMTLQRTCCYRKG